MNIMARNEVVKASIISLKTGLPYIVDKYLEIKNFRNSEIRKFLADFHF